MSCRPAVVIFVDGFAVYKFPMCKLSEFHFHMLMILLIETRSMQSNHRCNIMHTLDILGMAIPLFSSCRSSPIENSITSPSTPHLLHYPLHYPLHHALVSPFESALS
jgi:hypothetical protein